MSDDHSDGDDHSDDHSPRRHRGKPRSNREIEDRFDEIIDRLGLGDPLPADKTDLWFAAADTRRPDPDSEDGWLIDDPETGKTYAVNLTELWSAHVGRESPDHVVGDCDPETCPDCQRRDAGDELDGDGDDE